MTHRCTLSLPSAERTRVTRIDIVFGYHGTTKPRAEQILTEGFIPSRNPYDWLGDGVYFFERAPSRALEWAAEVHTPADACVVESEIELRDCLDLTDTAGVAVLQPFYDRFVATYGRETVERLRQTSGGRRFDCRVMNWACDTLEERGRPVRVIREAFEEGDPIWVDPGGDLAPSGIRVKTHVQLAVRDCSVIRATRAYDHGDED
jgi:hypothetical protein